MRVERLLLRLRLLLLIMFIAGLIAAHALFLGFNSWDGLS